MSDNIYDLGNYDFSIPQELIAQEPAVPRDNCNLLTLDRKDSSIKISIFKDILDFFKEGDVLVLNNTKVIRARLIGKKETGAKIEVLLLRERQRGVWEVLVRPGKRARVGDTIIFADDLGGKIIDKTQNGLRILEFSPPDIENFLKLKGGVPLPHYIKKEVKDLGDYQTVYAKKEGAVAAPTAGLHFTNELLNKIKGKGVNIVYVTLHCGLATFRPVKEADIRNHKIESEPIEVSEKVSEIINKAKEEKRRVIAVGTTAVRTLESANYLNKQGNYLIKPFCGETNLYIVPGYDFKIVDSLITNFHTPHSSNLIMVCAFSSLDLIRKSYLYASQQNLRFYSFGDAMLIT
jgi:S-adenosylmethionine:tRNA ribosyltransferase-isomerase